jgi:hypothetical protein
MTLVLTCCPTCRSNDPKVCATNCYNPWHRGLVVHLTPPDAYHAACSAPINDPPSELAADRKFVSCLRCLALCDRTHTAPTCDDPACYREEHAKKADEFLPGLGDLVRKGKLDPDLPVGDKIVDASDLWTERPAVVIKRHQELSDVEINCATADELRDAYRALREHHVAETTALVSRRDDITRRRDDLTRRMDALTENQQILAKGQQLLEGARSIMQRDGETIEQLSGEKDRLAEIIDFMRDHYSPIGGRSCALCVYEEGRFIRSCAIHRWDDTAAKLLATRLSDPERPMTDYLSDNELAAWLDRVGLRRADLEGTYLRLILDELRERRDAEAMFVDADLQLQALAGCETCADDTHATDHEHRAIVKRWRIAQGALCALARIHRGYLRSLTAPAGDSPL